MNRVENTSQSESALADTLAHLVRKETLTWGDRYFTSRHLADLLKGTHATRVPPLADGENLAEHLGEVLKGAIDTAKLKDIEYVELRSGPEGSAIAFHQRRGHTTDQLKQIYDYSKFHIGLYSAIIGYIAWAFFGEAKPGVEALSSHLRFWAGVSMFLLVAAGAAGGVIATSILDVRNHFRFWWSGHTHPSDPMDITLAVDGPKVGPAGWGLFRLRHWVSIEHTTFWLAVACLLYIAVCRSYHAP